MILDLTGVKQREDINKANRIETIKCVLTILAATGLIWVSTYAIANW
jgi:hypothetical protein